MSRRWTSSVEPLDKQCPAETELLPSLCRVVRQAVWSRCRAAVEPVSSVWTNNVEPSSSEPLSSCCRAVVQKHLRTGAVLLSRGWTHSVEPLASLRGAAEYTVPSRCRAAVEPLSSDSADDYDCYHHVSVASRVSYLELFYKCQK